MIYRRWIITTIAEYFNYLLSLSESTCTRQIVWRQVRESTQSCETMNSPWWEVTIMRCCWWTCTNWTYIFYHVFTNRSNHYVTLLNKCLAHYQIWVGWFRGNGRRLGCAKLVPCSMDLKMKKHAGGGEGGFLFYASFFEKEHTGGIFLLIFSLPQIAYGQAVCILFHSGVLK